MSGSGGGKPGVRQFWDADKEQVYAKDGTGFQTYTDAFDDMKSYIEKLEDRIKQLEVAYMEEKLLGKGNE